LAATRRSVCIHQINRVNSCNDYGHEDSTINIIVVVIIIIIIIEHAAVRAWCRPNITIINVANVQIHCINETKIIHRNIICSRIKITSSDFKAGNHCFLCRLFKMQRIDWRSCHVIDQFAANARCISVYTRSIGKSNVFETRMTMPVFITNWSAHYSFPEQNAERLLCHAKQRALVRVSTVLRRVRNCQCYDYYYYSRFASQRMLVSAVLWTNEKL